MSKGFTKVLLFLAGAILFVSAIALAEKPKTIRIYSDAVLPSGQELKAGEYQVDINETSKEVTFKKGNKIVGTAVCQFAEKPEKNAGSETRFGQKDNKQELRELRFGGERRSILLIGGGS